MSRHDRKFEDGRPRVSQTCRVCNATIRERRGVAPAVCADHLDHGEDWRRVRAGMAELEAELARLAAGGAADLDSLVTRDVLAMAADAESDQLGLVRLARIVEAPVPLVSRVLEAAQVTVYIRKGDHRRVLMVNKDEAREACMKLAARAVERSKEDMARKANKWTLLSHEQFMEVVVKVGNKTKLANAAGCGVSAIYKWANQESAPPIQAQAKLQRLWQGETLSEVAAPPRPPAAPRPLRSQQKAPEPAPVEEEWEDEDEE